MFRNAVVLFVVLLGLAQLSDPTAHLLTDVGGKVASLEAMSQGGDWDLDIGYWFEDADPDGRFYPLDKTTLTPNGKWVNTTSLTMIYPMRPLYAAGGARLAVVLPVLGAVMCALAAAALERRLGSTDGTWSFWLIGLASPVAVYSLDLWEHTLALAAMAYAVVAIHDAVHNVRPIAGPALAGLLFGLAATMRQEALVYGFVVGLVLFVESMRRSGIAASMVRSIAMVATTAVAFGAHQFAEEAALGGAARLQRSVGTPGVPTTWGDRLEGATTTTINLLNGTHPIQTGLGALFIVAVVWFTLDHLEGRTPHYSKLLMLGLLALAAMIYGARMTPVPSLIPAAPIALVGIVVAWRLRSWLPLVIGVAPIPLVLLTQFPGGHSFQWGARYLLLSGLVLTVYAISVLRTSNKELLIWFTVVSAMISSYGVVWGLTRIGDSAEDRASLTELTSPDDIVVWRSPIIAREMGSMSVGRNWLSAPRPSDQPALAELLRSEDVETFIWVEDFDNETTDFPGYEVGETIGQLDNFGFDVRVMTRTNN